MALERLVSQKQSKGWQRIAKELSGRSTAKSQDAAPATKDPIIAQS
jgi:hypothetical protein